VFPHVDISTAFFVLMKQIFDEYRQRRFAPQETDTGFARGGRSERVLAKETRFARLFCVPASACSSINTRVQYFAPFLKLNKLFVFIQKVPA
jgi:hypothetical protein